MKPRRGAIRFVFHGVARVAMGLPPILAETEAQADVQPFRDLPVILGEGLEADEARVEVVALVLVGEIRPVIAVFGVPVIDVVAVVHAGVTVHVADDGALELGAEFEVVTALDEVFGVVSEAGVDLITRPRVVGEVAGTVVAEVAASRHLGSSFWKKWPATSRGAFGSKV